MTTKTPKIKRRKSKVFTAQLLMILLVLIGLTFTGCKKETTPVPAPSAAKNNVKKKTAKPKQQAEVNEEPENNTNEISDLLDFSNRKDPFKPFLATQVPTGGGSRKQVAVTGDELPIHSFEVSQFRLIGTILDSKGNRAMVVDPAGKGYVLKAGMSIGKNEGKITKITTDGVDVVEQFRDENNKIRKETITIPLLRKP